MSLNEQYGNIFRAIFDSIAIPLFIVDSDVRILKYNRAGQKLIGEDHILKRRAGEILHCLYSFKSIEGCGRSTFCDDCVIRDSVNKAFEGLSTVRKKYKLELKKNDKTYNFFALITVSPIILKKNRYALLMIEDIAEILLMPKLLPICLRCKKINRDTNYWETIESYLIDHLEINFSHGYCPECFEKEKESLQRYLKEKKD